MGSGPVVLLDMDGVLVSNVAFEEAVTRYIIQYYAVTNNIAVDKAAQLWRSELVASSGMPEWYNYDFHCERLALPPLAKEAHDRSAFLLAAMPLAAETLDMLSQADVRFGIVSDAMRWIVEFKFEALNLRRPDFVYTSDMAGYPKKSPEFWHGFKELRRAREEYIYADNRLVNLNAAAPILTSCHLVCFAGDEHVLSIPGMSSNDSQLTNIGPVTAAADHLELAGFISRIILSDSNSGKALPLSC